MSLDHAAETIALAAYINAPRAHLDDADREMIEEDTAKARAAVETAWLEQKPTKPSHPTP